MTLALSSEKNQRKQESENDQGTQSALGGNLVMPPPFPDKDMKSAEQNRNQVTPPIEMNLKKIADLNLELGGKEINIPAGLRLHAIINGKLEGGYGFEKHEDGKSIIVKNPEGEVIGKVEIDVAKDISEIRGDLLKGLNKVFDSEKIKVNEDVKNRPENNFNPGDIEQLKKVLFGPVEFA